MLYEQLDLFLDFVLYAANSAQGLTIADYMDYLDAIADLDDIGARSDAFAKQLDELAAEVEE